MLEGMAEQPVTIISAARLTPVELAEVQALKQVCDAADGLDLKLVWGDGLSEAATVFLAWVGGQLVGYCSLDGDGTTAELCGMVAPGWRRRGLGLRLFEAACASFKNGGGEQLYAICEDASTAGRAFMGAFPAQRVLSEYRMELRADVLPPDDGALTIHQLNPSDEDGLLAAAHITSEGFERPLEQTLRHMRADLEQPAERLYLALADSEPVGAFKLYTEDSSVGIYGFVIDVARRRQGWGRRMLARACALAREQGATRVTLEVDTTNDRASALYTSSGFVTTTTYGYYLISRSLLAAGLGTMPSEESSYYDDV